MPSISAEQGSNSEACSAAAGRSENPTLPESLGALLRLLATPARALETLFTPAWPRFIVSLLLLYVLLPWQASTHLWPALEIGELFFLLNREFGVSLESYESTTAFLCSFGLGLAVLVIAILHASLLRFQGVRFPLLDSLSIATYSFLPFLVPMLLAVIGTLAIGEPRGLDWNLLIPLWCWAIGWGCYIWYRGSFLLTEISERALVLTGVLIVLLPLLLIVGVLTVPHMEMMQVWQGSERAPEGYLQDSIDAAQRSKE